MFSANRLKTHQYQQVFDTLLSLSKDGFIVVDREGLITDVSDIYARFLGLHPEDMIGRLITDVIPTSEMLNVMKQNRTDIDSVQAMNMLTITPESKKRIILVSRAPVQDEHGKIIGAVSHVKFHKQIREDIAKLDEMYEQLNSYKDEVYQAALERLALFEKRTAAPMRTDRQYLLLQYYQEEAHRQAMEQNATIIGKSEAFQQVKERAVRVAKTSFNVLITGDTGTGKEVIADLIHSSSERAHQPFIKINCAAIPNELLESELFGYVGGAFTGARKEGKKGKFEIADLGSIFLDEIADMPLNMQAKLLRVLQEGEIEPIGATHHVKVDVRVISATRRNIVEMVKNGDFREDLFYRLNVVMIHMPKLSDRREDILLFVEYILAQINKKYQTHVSISEEALSALQSYLWPGNIRELNNVIKGAYSMENHNQISIYNLPQHISSLIKSDKSNESLKEMMDEYEKEIITKVLLRNKFNFTSAAEQLGIHRSNLYKKAEKYKINENSSAIDELSAHNKPSSKSVPLKKVVIKREKAR